MKKAILKQEVERTFGRQLTETRDFEQLSHLFEPPIIIAYAREAVANNAETLVGILKERGSADQAAYARCAGSVCRL